MKKVLYTALVRSKLIYGLETIKMKDSTQKRTFKSLEGNCLKTAYGVNFRSKTASLSYGMGITPLGLYIHKRKLCFILVLLKNTATDELIYRGTHETLGDIIEKMGVRGEDIGKGPEQYRVILGTACVNRLKMIDDMEKSIKISPVVVAIEYLLSHRSVDNDDTLQYLLDPRRGSRG